MDNKNVKFLPTRLALPLFLVPRQRIKQNYSNELKSYMTKKIEFYTKSCQSDIANKDETDILDSTNNVTSVVDTKPYKLGTCKNVYKKVTRDLAEVYPWQLAPNIYDMEKEPFAGKKGIGGAYWRKKVAPKYFDKRTVKARIKFYNLPRETEKMQKDCHKHKGILVSNARERKPSTRSMIFDAIISYRDPKEPSPVSYNTYLKKRPLKMSPPAEEPYEFYRRSGVPLRRNACHLRHTSFQPAPGRYEIRFPKVSCCLGKLLYQPDLQILIDRQKRLKFRRLPYIKIKSRLYCSPDWRHVQGRGFRYLFRGGKPKEVTELEKVTKVKKGKEIKVNYLDSRYMHTINNPLRRPISLRFDSAYILPPRLEFNCLRKPTVRKTLRVNKKVVFGSGQSRFKDDHVKIFTVKQLEAIKNKLPLELQLRDHPVMTKSFEDIQSKFKIIPKRYSNVQIVTRLKDFRFSPLPEPKILVTKEDVRFEVDGQNGYYFKMLNAENFFKTKLDDDSDQSESSQF